MTAYTNEFIDQQIEALKTDTAKSEERKARLIENYEAMGSVR